SKSSPIIDCNSGSCWRSLKNDTSGSSRTTTVGSFQHIMLVVWDLAYAALADAKAVAGLTGFVMVSVVANAVVADAEVVAGLTGFLMVSPDPDP
ncbi:hypothetical protein A2U01_0057006, partial [Trifolium medium]|nr:hypothetical protein [Trifolium medium]